MACAVRAAVTGLALVLGAAAAAQDMQVTLQIEDGPSLTGALLGHDGARIRIDTEYGPLTVDAAAATCRGAACPPPWEERLAISGEGAIGRGVLPPLIEGFARARGLQVALDRPDGGHDDWTLTAQDGALLRVAVRHTTTAEGLADIIAEEADLAIALRPVRLLEAAMIEDAGLGAVGAAARARALGADALVPVVSPDGGAMAPTLPQLAALFAGALDDWADLGLPLGPVRLHLPMEGDGMAQAFEDAVMAPAGLTLAAEITRHADAGALARAVAADPGAIGIVRLGQSGPARVLGLRGGCGDPIRDDADAIRAGDHPLVLPILLYLPARRLPPMARDLAAYLAGPEAQVAIAAAGLVDRVPRRLPLAGQGVRLARAIRDAGEDAPLETLQDLVGRLRGADRLTTTFRFADGAATLDAPSTDHVHRLGARIAAGAFDGRTILLAGFSDAQGPGARNRRLSALRAEAVRAALVRAAGGPGGATIEAAGFGEAAPLACDDTPWGRRVNRRVEVWAD